MRIFTLDRVKNHTDDSLLLETGNNFLQRVKKDILVTNNHLIICDIE